MQENIFIQCFCCDRTSLVVSSHDLPKRRKMVSCIQYILSPPLFFSSLKKSMHTYCIGRVFSIGTNSGKGFAGVLHIVHLGQSSTFLLIIRSIPGQKYLCLADQSLVFTWRTCISKDFLKNYFPVHLGDNKLIHLSLS